MNCQNLSLNSNLANEILPNIRGTYLEELFAEQLNRDNLELARNSILEFTRLTKQDYYVNWHHQLICEKLDKFVSGEIKRLIICMPPQNGKSELVSRRLPAFLFGKHPNARIISCSYSADLAQRMNRDVQRIIDTPEYQQIFPEVSLNGSNVRAVQSGYLRNSDIFEIVGHEGVYRSCGIGGGITGMSMDYGIIDDYLKNREEAESKTMRDKIDEWYTDVFASREQGNSSFLITATRWNKDDLVGRLLKRAKENPEADQWELINLPALSEETRGIYDNRDGPDQPLWPWKYSYEWLIKKKANINPYSWLSLYQQRPVAVSGNLISEDQFKKCSLECFIGTNPMNWVLNLGETNKYTLSQCKIFQTCDPAASEQTSADYFALGTWAQTPYNELALIDLIHTRMEKPKQLPLMREQFLTWHPSTQWIATKGLGISLFQDLRAAGLPVNKIEEESDKVSRFVSACNRISTGTVYFREDLPKLNEYKTELLDFPNGEHDDYVDITSTATAVVSRYPYVINTYQTNYVGKGYDGGGMRI